MLETKSTPGFSLGCLQVWILEREFPDYDDYWDGNWLRVAARCTTQTASVEVTGPFIHLSDLETLIVNLEKLTTDLSGSFHAEFLKPYLNLEFTMTTLDQCEVIISLTPDNITEEHRFTCQLDQSYLTTSISELKQIVTNYPPKGLDDSTHS